MRLVSYKNAGAPEAGVWTDKGIVPLSAFGEGVPCDVLSVIEGGESVPGDDEPPS